MCGGCHLWSAADQQAQQNADVGGEQQQEHYHKVGIGQANQLKKKQRHATQGWRLKVDLASLIRKNFSAGVHKSFHLKCEREVSKKNFLAMQLINNCYGGTYVYTLEYS